MIYRQFKDKQLSGLGFGCMRLPVLDGNDAKIDEAAALDMIDYAMSHGINYFDTAWGYHEGNSELVVGKGLSKYSREEFYLADKFPGYDLSNMPKVKEIFEKQLLKCRVDYFDFYLIHNVCELNVEQYLDPKYGIRDYLKEQVRTGRIRHLGFSCHGNYETYQKFMSVYGEDMEFCQLQLNWLDWKFQKADEKVRDLKERNIPVWVMEPLRGGKLCRLEDRYEEKLKALRPDTTVTQWAFRFLQTLPEVGMVLSGMSSMEQMKQNIETWNRDEPLNGDEWDTLQQIADE
ncbi:MAG: aldo/keto reductase, partial [Firmicutes bacterium]|nr:aldo/keto reductase [Bacillota bacterium]